MLGAEHQRQPGRRHTVGTHVPTIVIGLSSGFASGLAGVEPQLRADRVGRGGVLGRQQPRRAGRRNVQPAALSGERAAITVTYLAISAGDSVTCAIVFGGVVQCWGANNAGELGRRSHPADEDQHSRQCSRTPGHYGMDAGGDHTCVLTPVARPQVLGPQCGRRVGRWHDALRARRPSTSRVSRAASSP